MKVYFVGAGAGDPELLTRKAYSLLLEAKICIYAGSLLNPRIVELVSAAAKKYDSAKMNLEETTRVCLEAKKLEQDVVRLHSGEPVIYGAIGEQMRRLQQHGIDYEIVPGISAFQAAAAALKKELTSPEVSQTVILTRTSGRTPMPKSQKLEKLAASKATLCIYLSTQKLGEVTESLIAFYGKNCPAAVVYHASWPDQLIIEGNLSDLGEKAKKAGLDKTAIILVGRALGGTEYESKLYDKSFTHEFRKGSEK